MNILEQKEQIKEDQRNDAYLLIEKMYSFIPMDKNIPKNAFISAKYCAKVACDYLIENTPNINLTPPIHRKKYREYSVYWMGVKREIEVFKKLIYETNKI